MVEASFFRTVGKLGHEKLRSTECWLNHLWGSSFFLPYFILLKNSLPPYCVEESRDHSVSSSAFQGESCLWTASLCIF